MLAVVRDAEGKPLSLHRTFLHDDSKAPVECPRKLMPGLLSEGYAIRLGPANRVLGVAEGIETALAAAVLYELPVWAAVNSGNLAKWWPPEGTEEVLILGDAATKFGGQAAAYALAHRLAVKGIEVTVRLPETLGLDWNDELRKLAA